MNRRSTLKYIFSAGILGLGLNGLYKYITYDNFDIYSLPGKKNLIAEIAEIIIPRTDTPGAKDAQVELFIIAMIMEASDKKIQHNFMKGLADLEEYAYHNFQRDFLKCSPSQKVSILTYFEKSSNYSYLILNKINNKIFGMPFFIKVKSLTIEGYCTSELGAKQGLAYDYIPGSFVSCIPLKNKQRAWATK